MHRLYKITIRNIVLMLIEHMVCVTVVDRKRQANMNLFPAFYSSKISRCML